MKKAVFFDIDGTIWNERMEIPESTILAIRGMRRQGHYAFICSGRSRANIRDPKLLGIGFDGILAGCGTDVEYHGEKIFELLLAPEQISRVMEICKRNQMSALLEGPRCCYYRPEEFVGDFYIEYLKKELGADMKVMDDCTAFEVNKFSVALHDTDIEQVTKELGADFDVVTHHAKLIEILPHGYTKATGIQTICEKLGIRREDTYAFGDSANDLEMLSYVGHGIAMGNGTDAVKQTAEYVTASVMKDGIRAGLQHYGLL
jgi:hypothetical protein